ncbi:arylsulfatase [Algoriphagus machipongonensis]|uniref:Sulfatase family protein n=1 Tax=Algoriphagus machipongonensis TaxID=388413 RepID=A3HUP5_9BACT|nr:arylsulfatase [Algoriphagus machipongonensis]EAZ81867.1 sulfatase family protein [Algoriphagus machipongonensis]
MKQKLSILKTAIFALLFLPFLANAQDKPNIVVIWGDDIGYWNVGAYTHGMMGRTPNIDGIARDGMLFTDHYGQPSCTAGRAAFIMGQLPVRTGMTTIGIPGSTQGIQAVDPTLAQVLKAQGYATAQFGKNHLGDRNEFLPTMHGFDEWFGNLYHLNAEEEPEELDYPGQKNPAYKEKFGPRGVLHTWATDTDDPTVDPKFGKVGKQRIEDTGPLTRKRMETIDSEVTDETLKYLDRVGKEDKPFFVWYNTTATHIWSHSTNKYIQAAVDEGRAEEDVVRAKMIEHDELIGKILQKIKDMGEEDNTIVIYSTDNGNELMYWPDGGYAPFRGEKGTTWEGGLRVPMLVKWPGKIPAGTYSNGIQSHEDLYVTLAAAAGAPNLKEELLNGKDIGGTTFKTHLDGYNNLDLWTGKTDKSARREMFYYDESDLMAIRVDAWKMHIGVKHGGSWFDEKSYPSVPYIVNLLMDPMEKMTPDSEEWGYAGRKFVAQKLWAPTAAVPFIQAHLKSLLDYPPSQGGESLNMKASIERAMKAMEQPTGGVH